MPAYIGPVLSWIFAVNFLSTQPMKIVPYTATKLNPGKTVRAKSVLKGSVERRLSWKLRKSKGFTNARASRSFGKWKIASRR
ncbi:MAG: hypothetical protein ACLQEQ_06565 [Nitrososphaerales archaeon]